MSLPAKAAHGAQTYRGPSQRTTAASPDLKHPPQPTIIRPKHRTRGSTASQSFNSKRGIFINKDSSLPTIMTNIISPKPRAPSQTHFGRNINIQSISSGNYVNVNDLMEKHVKTNTLMQQVKSRTNTVRNRNKTSMNLI